MVLVPVLDSHRSRDCLPGARDPAGYPGDDWHAVLVTGETEQIIEPIGTGTHDATYWYRVNHYQSGIVGLDKRDKRRRTV